jgi:hypothetical protein
MRLATDTQIENFMLLVITDARGGEIARLDFNHTVPDTDRILRKTTVYGGTEGILIETDPRGQEVRRASYFPTYECLDRDGRRYTLAKYADSKGAYRSRETGARYSLRKLYAA